MKIESYEIGMQSQHSFTKEEVESSVSFSTVCLEVEAQKQAEASQEVQTKKWWQEDDTQRMLYALIQSLIDRLNNSVSSYNNYDTLSFTTTQQTQDEVDSCETQTINLYHTTLDLKYKEQEELNFSTVGHIQTDSGSLDIDLNFSMQRSFVVENRIDTYSLFDPLVINLDGDIPNLSQDTFSFDLDNDGEKDQISKLGENSGFLALDLNNDGEINQGSELFGTKTGDGFDELSEYDSDNNGWIDENDDIFDKLQIWIKNDDTDEKDLIGLGEAGVGAIFLNSQSSEFTYKTQTNQTLGEMKSCGMFLKEDGSCGSISQIDFAMRDTKDEITKKEPLMELLQA